MECLTCRKAGVKTIYVGELARSSYQHGREHEKEVREGMLNHPLVQHFWEEHGRKEQELMMRVLSRHIKALERQVQDSIMIERMVEVSKECLNLKSY